MRAKRRGRVTESEIEYFLVNLRSFNLAIDQHSLASLDHVRELADTYNLSAYYAGYLELALRSGLPLATLDERLGMAATIEGVAVP